jgi:hypothetical protein
VTSSRDFSDPLKEEILTQMADTFFRPRKEVERGMDLVQEYARILKRSRGRLEATAALLHRLLLSTDNMRVLFGLLGVDARPYLTGEAPSASALRRPRPFAWSARNRYLKVVRETYAALKVERDRYMEGERRDGGGGSPPVYYRLVEEICRQVNQHVHRINSEISPSDTLQFVKRLDPEREERERITGATGNLYAHGMESRFCYRPIPFASLEIPAYPPLPSVEKARPILSRFARTCWRQAPGEVRRRLAAMKP